MASFDSGYGSPSIETYGGPSAGGSSATSTLVELAVVDPSAVAPQNDWGYGSWAMFPVVAHITTPTTPFFDSGIYTPTYPFGLLPTLTLSPGPYSDEGGDVVTVTGAFAENGWTGPFYVRIVPFYNSDGTATTYPSLGHDADSQGYAYKGKPGISGSLDDFISIKLDSDNQLSFTLPRCPPAPYTVYLYMADAAKGFDTSPQTYTFAPGLQVKVRSRAPATYRMRRSMPPVYKTGAVTINDEPKVETP